MCCSIKTRNLRSINFYKMRDNLNYICDGYKKPSKTIGISMCSYRDPDLFYTIDNMIKNVRV